MIDYLYLSNQSRIIAECPVGKPEIRFVKLKARTLSYMYARDIYPSGRSLSESELCYYVIWTERCVITGQNRVKTTTHVKAVERLHFLFLLNNDYGFVAKPLPFVVA